MPKYLIDRTIPGAHKMTPEELREAARTSCGVLDALGPDIRWEQSYVTEDRVTCVYHASDEKVVQEHARRSGFPATRIAEIVAGMDPTTAEPARVAPSA